VRGGSVHFVRGVGVSMTFDPLTISDFAFTFRLCWGGSIERIEQPGPSHLTRLDVRRWHAPPSTWTVYVPPTERPGCGADFRSDPA